jgi:hypothetical protein
MPQDKNVRSCERQRNKNTQLYKVLNGISYLLTL